MKSSYSILFFILFFSSQLFAQNWENIAYTCSSRAYNYMASAKSAEKKECWCSLPNWTTECRSLCSESRNYYDQFHKFGCLKYSKDAASKFCLCSSARECASKWEGAKTGTNFAYQCSLARNYFESNYQKNLTGYLDFLISATVKSLIEDVPKPEDLKNPRGIDIKDYKQEKESPKSEGIST